MKNWLLCGIVGSTAYGLNHPGSDVDRLGVYAVDTVELHGLQRPGETIVETNPDVTLHEIGKYCALALKCNPTVTELMWLPDDLIETTTPVGDELIDLRASFLSARRVRGAYLGYAVDQFRRLQQRGDGTFGPDLAKRTAKHARHMYRLLIQGLQLWTTGRLAIQLDNPDVVTSFGSRVAQGDIEYARKILADYEHAFDSASTVLPDEPDKVTVDQWLRGVRRTYYQT